MLRKEIAYLSSLVIALIFLLATPSVEQQKGPDVSLLGNLMLRTPHFTIEYRDSTMRPAAVSLGWGMEIAYQHLVVKRGFRDGRHNWTLLDFPQGISLDFLDASTTGVHEYFHSIQELGYRLTTYGDRFLIEGTAFWAELEVFPKCVAKCFSTTYGALELLTLGTDIGDIQSRFPGYQGGLFWLFVTDRYGGAELIRRLFEHPDIVLGANWMKALSNLLGNSFLDIWAEFAVALAAHQIPYAAAIYALAEQKTPYVPVPVFVGEWTGQPLYIGSANWDASRGKLTAPSKSPLYVRHAYGIHFLRIIPKSAASLALHVEIEKNYTDGFRIYLVAQKASGAYAIFSLKKECVLPKPTEYSLLQIVITRGPEVPGKYQLRLQEPQTLDYTLCQGN